MLPEFCGVEVGMEKEKYELSALDAYINRVYKFAVLFVPILCLCAGGTITILNGLNLILYNNSWHMIHKDL